MTSWMHKPFCVGALESPTVSTQRSLWPQLLPEADQSHKHVLTNLWICACACFSVYICLCVYMLLLEPLTLCPWVSYICVGVWTHVCTYVCVCVQAYVCLCSNQVVTESATGAADYLIPSLLEEFCERKNSIPLLSPWKHLLFAHLALVQIE